MPNNLVYFHIATLNLHIKPARGLILILYRINILGHFEQKKFVYRVYLFFNSQSCILSHKEIVKLCVHLVSMFHKVQKWTQTDTFFCQIKDMAGTMALI